MAAITQTSNNTPALVQVMSWGRAGDEPLFTNEWLSQFLSQDSVSSAKPRWVCVCAGLNTFNK